MDVLLVEDDALIREFLAEDLVDAGLHVMQAPSAEAALRTATGEAPSQPPVVLVTDVNLGAGMNGIAGRRSPPPLAQSCSCGHVRKPGQPQGAPP